MALFLCSHTLSEGKGGKAGIFSDLPAPMICGQVFFFFRETECFPSTCDEVINGITNLLPLPFQAGGAASLDREKRRDAYFKLFLDGVWIDGKKVSGARVFIRPDKKVV